ncbi:MAG: acyl-CoA thioesterase [Nitrososphaerales archaeon]|jgi:acyl-CoA hydrolase
MARERRGRAIDAGRPGGRPVSESVTTSVRIMMPADANIRGNVFGGAIMKYMDEIAAVAAFRHARKNVVTASIDRMNFIAPVYLGNLLVLKASVNYVGRTSMEIGVRMEAEDLRSGRITHVGSCFLTYVALDDEGRPTSIEPVIPVTDDEKRRYREAATRRQIREAERAQLGKLGV